jgi:CheY-specific phosphatase CheX
MAARLRHAANAVFQTMFMSPVLADQEFPPSGVIDPLLVGLAFHGEVRGTFALAVASETAERLSLHFMGMTPGEPIERQSVIEVVGELANMLCGHVLGQLNYHDTFRLTSPCELVLSEFAPKGRTYQRTVHLDEGALSMQVAVEESPDKSR